MSTITNIPRSHVEQGQYRKEVTANLGFDGVAARVTDQAAIDLSGATGSTYTLAGLTVGVARVLKLSGAPGETAITFPLDATYDAEDPTALEGEWTFVNADSVAHSVFAAGSSATVTLPANTTVQVRFDGTDLFKAASGVGPNDGRFYIITSTIGTPPASDMFLIATPIAIRLPAGLVGSALVAGVAPTLDAAFTLEKNGVGVGTFSFLAGQTTGNGLGVAADVDYAVNDTIGLVGPSPTDATLADLALTFNLERI